MKKLSLVLVLALFGISSMLAQRTITGTVSDEKGEPLIGVSVFARGTSVGTVTDIDGTYSLRVPEGANTLIFSYTGFATEEVVLGASNTVDLALRGGHRAVDRGGRDQPRDQEGQKGTGLCRDHD